MFSKDKGGRSGGGRGGFRRGGDSSGRRNFGGDRNGGERSFSRKSSFGGDRDSERVNFKATCDDCGKDCNLPFKPSGNKPVYCSDCYEKRGNGKDSSSSRSNNSREDRGSADLRNQLYHIEDKLDQVLELLKRR